MLKLAKTMVPAAEFSGPNILPETGESGRAHDVVNGLRCLDVRCGSGTSTHAAAQLGAHYSSSNPGHANISFAHKVAQRFGARNLASEIGNAQKLELMKGTFDLVNCHGVLHHLEEAERALREICSVLTNGGHHIFGHGKVYCWFCVDQI